MNECIPAKIKFMCCIFQILFTFLSKIFCLSICIEKICIFFMTKKRVYLQAALCDKKFLILTQSCKSLLPFKDVLQPLQKISNWKQYF